MRKSLVDCAARGKLFKSRRANMAQSTNLPPLRRCSFAYASCNGVSVACAMSVVHAAMGATAPRRREPLPDVFQIRPPSHPPRRRATACRPNTGAGRSPRSSPRWRWPRSIPRSPTSRCPTIAADLHVSPEEVVWVVNVDPIALVATLLPLGALGAIVGHQRIYLGGLILFTVASLGCALAWSLASLLVARALQGLGASGLMSVNTALVRFVYPGPCSAAPSATTRWWSQPPSPSVRRLRLQSSPVGPWPWLFAVNIPFGLIAILIGLRTLPKTPRAEHGFDFYERGAHSKLPRPIHRRYRRRPHQSPPALVGLELVTASLLGWMMTRSDADHPTPMLPIDLFRRPMFALSAATAVCSFAVQGLAFVSLPFYFEEYSDRSQVETGFFMTPWPLVVASSRQSADGSPIAIPSVFSAARPGAARPRHGAAGDAASGARHSRYRLADDDLRDRIRLLPNAEPAGDDGERAVAPQRQRLRHRRDRASDRTNARRRAGRGVLRPRRS